MIVIMALAVAILQGNPYTSVAFGAPRQVQVLMLFLVSILATGIWGYKVKTGKLSYEGGLLFTVFFGTLMRVGYVLFVDIQTLQNDGGTFTGYGTSQINDGHIGYIEYIYKFFHLPDMDPYEHFGYYHPPFHHIIEALWLTVQRFIGVPEKFAFENLQVPTLIYSALCMVVMLHILEESGVKKNLMAAGLALFAFHPRMMVLAGSVNNDILALLLLLVTIWRTLSWIHEKTFKNVILIALALGFGMISKLNTAICAFSIAVLFLVCLINRIKDANTVKIKEIILQYVVFGVICIPIGLSYIVRNIVFFGEKPGIPSPAIIPNESVMYTGEFSVWSIIGIPSFADWHVAFPFHPLSAKAIHNTWVILFQTGLFAEIYPAGASDHLLSAAQIAYVSSIILALVTTVVFLVGFVRRFFKEFPADRECFAVTGFLWLTYVFMLLSFGLYVFKYPYTCSSDFRYMTASLVFTSLGYVLCRGGAGGIIGSRDANSGVSEGEAVKKSGAAAGIFGYVMKMLMILTLGCSLVFYIGWFLG